MHIQNDVLPNALRYLLRPVSAALASIFRMDSIFTSYESLDMYYLVRSCDVLFEVKISTLPFLGSAASDLVMGNSKKNQLVRLA